MQKLAAFNSHLIPVMYNYEKLGLFYLGRTANAAGETTGEDYLYDAKDLTTHAVIVGMTGSGKTGLGITLLEEAAIDGIPVIAIDPKGDLGNLLLTFPNLRQEDFRPWVEPSAASVAGQTVDQYAAAVAERSRKGLAEWNEPPERIRRFADSVDRSIYTPGSTSGVPITVLKSFAAPPAALVGEAEAFRDRISASTDGLLSLVGVKGDLLTSREHVLIATILDEAWRAGRNVEIGDLIRSVQTPPFDRVGVFDLETFYPAKERVDLAMRLNNLLASPGFAGWLEGESLDVGRLLYTAEGKPRLSILSIAHLTDAERMFFVTLLLGEVLSWVRKQPGTSSLRAILYMDEVAGYFPPVGEPPSKRPMLTLLKQARAYGLGCVLATQNPVDLDYKGLSNTGTWFLGRLQTERDKARVLEGLEGASAASGAVFDRAKIEATLAGLSMRTFLVNNVHEDAPIVMKTRWALSYLRGPLTRDQISLLMEGQKAQAASRNIEGVAKASPGTAASPATDASASRPVLPPGIEEYLVPTKRGASGSIILRPAVLGRARLHFVKRGSTGIDTWLEKAFVLPVQDGGELDWDVAETVGSDSITGFEASESDVRFAESPAALLNAGSYKDWAKSLKEFIYRTQTLTLWSCPSLKEMSEANESEGEFRVRLTQQAREARDLAVEKLRKKYASKVATLEKRIRTAEQRVEREQGQATRASFDTMLSIGSTVLSALFGRKLVSSTNVGRAATAARSVGRAADQRSDVKRVAGDLEHLKAELDELNAEVEAEVERVASEYDPQSIVLEAVEISPRKSDLQIAPVAVVWCPWKVDANGFGEPAWERNHR